MCQVWVKTRGGLRFNGSLSPALPHPQPAPAGSIPSQHSKSSSQSRTCCPPGPGHELPTYRSALQPETGAGYTEPHTTSSHDQVAPGVQSHCPPGTCSMDQAPEAITHPAAAQCVCSGTQQISRIAALLSWDLAALQLLHLQQVLATHRARLCSLPPTAPAVPRAPMQLCPAPHPVPDSHGLPYCTQQLIHTKLLPFPCAYPTGIQEPLFGRGSCAQAQLTHVVIHL